MISFPAVTEMFQFSAFAPFGLCIQPTVIPITRDRVSPFGDPRIKACLAAPLGLTQPTTSFIASSRLDIHHAPLVAWPHLPQALGDGPGRSSLPEARALARAASRLGACEISVFRKFQKYPMQLSKSRLFTREAGPSGLLPLRHPAS